jgi:hypothetical protein
MPHDPEFHLAKVPHAKNIAGFAAWVIAEVMRGHKNFEAFVEDAKPTTSGGYPVVARHIASHAWPHERNFQRAFVRLILSQTFSRSPPAQIMKLHAACHKHFPEVFE